MPTAPLAIEYSGHEGVTKRRFTNMYFEQTPNGPQKSVRYQRPGLVLNNTFGAGPIRCSFLWQGHRILVSNTDVFFDGLRIGAVPGTDLCRFAVSDEEVVIIGAQQAWYVTSAAVNKITDPDIFPSICDVLFLSGRFLYLSAVDSQFQWSAVGDAQNIDGLDFATADENSSQILVGGFILNDDMVLFMGSATEWWSSNDDVNAPYIRSPGRKYNKGLAARNTTVLLDNTVFWLGSDKQVYRASSVPQRVSNFDIEDLIEGIADADFTDASAFGQVLGGHTYFVLNLPDKGTWALDIASGKFAEWKTWNKDRFRITVADETLLGDLYSGNVYTFNKNTFLDDGDPIERILTAFIPIKAGSVINFNLCLKCMRGPGLMPPGYGSDPKVEMRFSDNDGYNYTNWMEAPLGLIGDRTDDAKAIWYQLGAMVAPGRIFEFRCTDPIFWAPVEIVFNEMRP